MKLTVLLLLCSISPALAGVRELWWNITYVENANPDGLADRRVIGDCFRALYLPASSSAFLGVNNTWPPPPIEVNTTDSLVVHMTNSLPDAATSLHHHGMFFNKSSFMDGAVGVSEW